MTEIKERGDRMEEACGVFGIYAQDEAINVAEAAYYGLFALQHRGQESAGIAVAVERALSIIATSALCRRCLTKKSCTG